VIKNKENEGKFSSPGLEDLLKRAGIRPTGIRCKDIQLAKPLMAKDADGLFKRDDNWPSHRSL